MATNTIDGNLTVKGRLTPAQLDVPAGAVGNAGISPSANVGAEKLQHRWHTTLTQPNTTAAAETRVVFVARAAAEIMEFVAGSIAKCIGDSTISLDLKKNGTTVLSSLLVLDSTNTNRVVEIGTLNPASVALVAGDVVEIVVTVSAGTGTLGTGLFAAARIDEDAS